MQIDVATDGIARDVALRPPLRPRDGGQSSFEIIVESDAEHYFTCLFNTLNVAVRGESIKALI